VILVKLIYFEIKIEQNTSYNKEENVLRNVDYFVSIGVLANFCCGHLATMDWP
jgi:hypothetical protein